MRILRNHCTCLGLHVSHDDIFASVTRHGGGAMNIQSVAYVRRNFGFGNLWTRSGRGAQVSAIITTIVASSGAYCRL